MLLTLVRHGRATAADPDLGDAGRVLSAEGRAQLRRTGDALARRGVAPTHLLCSPLVRAVQTAELLGASVGFEGVIVATADLLPEASLGALLARVQPLGEDADVLLAGHEPFMSGLATALLGTPTPGFGTADAWRLALDVAEPGVATLRWRWSSAHADFA